MGSLRLFLAISVIAAHAGFQFGVGGVNAVEIFFIISGYLISHILVGDGKYSKIGDFYLNRALRIYPLYIVVALCSLLVNVVLALVHGSPFFHLFDQLNAQTRALVVFVNSVLFFQDALLFIDENVGTWSLVTNLSDTHLHLHVGLLVPQAWSLALELCFYLLAPLLLRRRGLLLSFLTASAVVKLVLVVTGLGQNDPWSYRFFPAELSFFLLGAASHKYMAPVFARSRFENQLSVRAATWIVIGFSVSYSLLPGPEVLKSLGLISVVLLLLPALFRAQSGSKLDARFAALSFPSYLWHVVAIMVFGPILTKLNVSPGSFVFFLAIVIITLIVSEISNRLLDSRIEAIRVRIRNRQLQG